MTQRVVNCPVHGRVFGFCRQCKIERYLERVRTGEIKAKPLVEITDRPIAEPSPLQIRFRAFMSRVKKSQSGRAHSWEQSSRGIRIITTKYLGDSL